MHRTSSWPPPIPEQTNAQRLSQIVVADFRNIVGIIRWEASENNRNSRDRNSTLSRRASAGVVCAKDKLEHVLRINLLRTSSTSRASETAPNLVGLREGGEAADNLQSQGRPPLLRKTG